MGALLYVNGSSVMRLSAGLVVNGRIKAQRSVIRTRQPVSQELALVTKVMGRRKFSTLRAVAVVNHAPVESGATFSQLRASVTCANAVAYANGIPVVSAAPMSVEAFARSTRRLAERARRGVPVLPYYQRPPNITFPQPKTLMRRSVVF